MTALKVYGYTGIRPEARIETNRHGQTREIVAARSVAEVLRITGMPRSAFDRSGCTTGNAEEIEIAMSRPGVVYWKPLNGPGEYTPAEAS